MITKYDIQNAILNSKLNDLELTYDTDIDEIIIIHENIQFDIDAKEVVVKFYGEDITAPTDVLDFEYETVDDVVKIMEQYLIEQP